MMKKYTFSFDAGGLLLFLFIMLPNFIWFALPAPHDILRRESVTGLLDGIASVCQVLLVAALCAVVNKERGSLRVTPLILASAGCGLLYYAGWVLYYLGLVHPLVILLLTLPPCLTFLFFAVDRKNWIAVIPAAVFTVCHLIYGVVNFMI